MFALHRSRSSLFPIVKKKHRLALSRRLQHDQVHSLSRKHQQYHLHYSARVEHPKMGAAPRVTQFHLSCAFSPKRQRSPFQVLNSMHGCNCVARVGQWAGTYHRLQHIGWPIVLLTHYVQLLPRTGMALPTLGTAWHCLRISSGCIFQVKELL